MALGQAHHVAQRPEDQPFVELRRRPAGAIDAVGVGPGEIHRRFQKGFLDRPGVGHRQGHVGLDLFPDARHAEEDSRRNLAQVLLNGAQAFAEIHLIARLHRKKDGKELFGHVTERQVGDDPIFVRARRHLQRRIANGGDVAERDHRRLGQAGGAGGKDDQRGVVGMMLGEHPVEKIGLTRRFAVFHHRGVRGELGVVVAAQALFIDGDDFADHRQVVDDFQHLVDLLLILADHGDGVRR